MSTRRHHGALHLGPFLSMASRTWQYAQDSPYKLVGAAFPNTQMSGSNETLHRFSHPLRKRIRLCDRNWRRRGRRPVRSPADVVKLKSLPYPWFTVPGNSVYVQLMIDIAELSIVKTVGTKHVDEKAFKESYFGAQRLPLILGKVSQRTLIVST